MTNENQTPDTAETPVPEQTSIPGTETTVLSPVPATEQAGETSSPEAAKPATGDVRFVKPGDMVSYGEQFDGQPVGEVTGLVVAVKNGCVDLEFTNGVICGVPFSKTVEAGYWTWPVSA